MPFCRPTNNVRALKGRSENKMIIINYIASITELLLLPIMMVWLVRRWCLAVVVS